MPPAKSDRVRRYLIEQYIVPARAIGEKTVGPVRGSDVANEVGLQHYVPLVCDAMTGPKLQRQAKVTVEVLEPAPDLVVRYALD